MKNKFLRLFFCITLMFGFALTIASCKKQETVNPDDGKGNEEEPPKKEEPVTLTKLPDGYYTKLFQTPDSIVITFKDAEFAPVDSDKDVRYVIGDESIIRIGIVDDTLKANGYLKLYETYPYGSYINEAYFSLDDSFIASSITYAEPNLSYQLPETATETKIHYLTDISNKDIYYNEIKLSKTEITTLINGKLEELGFDFDVSTIKSLKDLTTLIGIPNETVDTTKAQIEGLYTKLMEMFFKASFKQNEITLSLTFDSLKLYNTLGKTLTIQAIVDSVLGEGKFVEILELLEDYSKVDKTKVTAPQDNQQYYTLVDGEYVPCENLTTWDPDTEYYIDNKDLGEFTLADLLKTSAEDTVGFVSVEEIDALVEKLYELIGKATPAMEESSFNIGSILAKLDLSIYIQMIAAMFGVSQYYVLEPVTDLTEWEGLNEDGTGTVYYSSIYSECGAITEFDEGTLYFTMNDNDEFVLVDTKNATPAPNTTYYYFDPVLVNNSKVLKTPEENTTYYNRREEYTYSDVEMVVEWDANDTYYTLTYVECENLSAWAPDTDYYYFDYINNTYEWVDPEEIPTPYAGTKYYTERYDEVDKTLVPAPEQDGLYFKYYEAFEGYLSITTHFEENETYYVKDGEEYLPTTDTTPQAGVKYFTRNTNYVFSVCEGLTQFEAGIEYYISEELGVFELVDIYEIQKPDSEETYYRVTNRIGQLLACEPMQKLTVNEIASKVYMILARTGKIDVNMDYLINGIKIPTLLAPYVQEFKDAKLYDLFAEIYDTVKPEYTVFEGTEWEANTSYFTYDEEDEEYQEVDLEAVTAPEDDVVYYVLKDRTGAEIGAMIDDAIDALNENVSLKIVTDNDVKLQTIELKVTQAPIFGTITVDFTKLYSDQVRSTLMHDVDYASERDDESTAILESYITDGCFDGYERSGVTYELVIQNGEYVGVKRIQNNQEHIYLFGTNEKNDDDYDSAKEYYAEGYIEIRATLYDAANKSYETFNWFYNLTTKKFEYKDDMNYEDLYYYDYSKNEYVSVYIKVDTTDATMEENTLYFTYDSETKKYYVSDDTTFNPEVTYYKWVKADGDATHPFVIKKVNRFTKAATYHMVYFPATAA